MKKKFIIILFSLLISAVLAVIAFKLWESGAFIFERSTDISSEHVTWNGKDYSSITGDYTEGRTIAKGENDWVINLVKEDPSQRFIVARSFLDQYLMVSNDYSVPTTGELTTVSWNKTYITDASFLDAIIKIEAEKTTSFTYKTDNIHQLTETQHLRSIYVAYENCPVATNFLGYMGKINGEWVITTHISQDTVNADGSPKTYSVSCYVIPAEYWDILAEHFN